VSGEARRAVPELVPIRMLNEYVYCPRLFHLEWVQSEWADNYFTEHGRDVHRRADAEQARPLDPTDEDAGFKTRSLELTSERLGLTTRLDVVEAEGGRVVPVEYKRGKPAPVPHRVHDPERVQVCAQALVLRDNGFEVPSAAVFFAGSRERVEVPLSEDLIAMTRRAIEELRETARRPVAPPPLIDDPRCNGCSLVGICLPDEVHHLRPSAASRAEERPLRRVVPARDDALPFYVQQGGTKLGVQGDLLVVKERGKKVGEAQLPRTSQVAVFGGVQVSTQAVRRLLRDDIPLLYYSAGGWFYGWTRGHGSKNVELRRAQFRVADDAARSLDLARTFVTGKIANQRTVLRRNGRDARDALEKLARLRRKAEHAPSLEALLGLEGSAARLYFETFPGLLRGDFADFEPNGRNRRPPRDPINALLSFLYALLAKDWTLACATAGLDPYLGFFHQPRFGRASLALDLMEEFRPLVADSVVLTVSNTRALGPTDFVARGVGVALSSRARKKLIGAYERRLDETITHPVFGYRISYRRTFEVQARLLGRYLTGEIPAYPSFRTR